MTPEEKYNQTMRYSQEELQLMKDFFPGNWVLLNALRKNFLQMNMTAVDLGSLELVKQNKALVGLLRKHFLPELSDDVPFSLQSDFKLVAGIKELMPDIAVLHIKSLDLCEEYIRERLDNLFEGKEGKISFKDFSNIKDKLDIDTYVNVLARNTIINHIESKLNELKILAGKKEESPEETIKRIRKDSSK